MLQKSLMIIIKLLCTTLVYLSFTNLNRQKRLRNIKLTWKKQIKYYRHCSERKNKILSVTQRMLEKC